MKKKILPLSVFFIVLLTGNVKADLAFSGNLLDLPCKIDPSSETQEVVFYDTPVQQFLEQPGKSPVKRFSIKLISCRSYDIEKIVKLTFTGEEEPTEPGALKVNGVNEGKLAIHFIDSDGSTPIKLNEQNNGGEGVTISSQSIVMDFGAFVQATQKALLTRSVTPGDYGAIATFKLVYQ